jgi:cytoskeletal protein RodZ
MWYTGRNKRIAAAAALGALTVLLATGCSFSIGDAEKKSDATASEDAAAVEKAPDEEQPTAEEKPAGDDPAEPGNTGVSEEGAVHKARVAQTISDKLTADTGKRPDRVTCPEHLPARVGATIRCELTAGSDTLGVTVTATSVNGKQVNYNFKVDDSVG